MRVRWFVLVSLLAVCGGGFAQNLKWAAGYGAVAPGFETVDAVYPLADRGAILVGSSASIVSADLPVVRRIRANGSLVWTRIVDPPEYLGSTLKDSAMAPSGVTFVLSRAINGADILTAVSPSGSVLWSRRPSVAEIGVFKVLVAPNGNPVLVGSRRIEVQSVSIYGVSLRSYQASTGQDAREVTLFRESSRSFFSSDAAWVGDQLVVVGTVTPARFVASAPSVWAFRADLTSRWIFDYPYTTKTGSALAVAGAADGTLFVAGRDGVTGTPDDLRVFSPDGTQRRALTFSTAHPEFVRMAVDPSGVVGIVQARGASYSFYEYDAVRLVTQRFLDINRPPSSMVAGSAGYYLSSTGFAPLTAQLVRVPPRAGNPISISEAQSHPGPVALRGSDLWWGFFAPIADPPVARVRAVRRTADLQIESLRSSNTAPVGGAENAPRLVGAGTDTVAAGTTLVLYTVGASQYNVVPYVQKRRANGTIAWTRTLPTSVGAIEWQALAALPGGDVVALLRRQPTALDPTGLVLYRFQGGTGTPLWSRVLGLSLSERITQMETLRVFSNGDIVVAGQVRNPLPTGDDPFVMRVRSSNGVPIWTRVVRGTAPVEDFTHVSETPGGGVVAAGRRAQGSESIGILSAWTAAGALRWSIADAPVVATQVRTAGLEVTAAGDIWWLRSVDQGTSRTLGLALRRGANGAAAWAEYRYPALNSRTDPVALRLAGGTDAVVGATSQGTAGTTQSADWLVFRVRPNRTFPWAGSLRRIAGPFDDEDKLTAMEVDATGRIFLTGTSRLGSRSRVLTGSVSATGALRWLQPWTFPGSGIGAQAGPSVALGPDGVATVSAMANVSGQRTNAFTLRYGP